MPQETDQFYSSLPVQKIALHKLLLKDQLFHKVPADWCVIITDIKSSTLAVGSGLHENVNLIATGSIVTVLNMALRDKITIPFFFGGDGATFIMPGTLVKKVLPALLLYKARTLETFSLELRIGTVPVTDLYNHGHLLNICRYCLYESFPIPVVTGNGLNYAEAIIKGDDYLLSGHETQEETLDLNGMQCRWDRIPPPEDKEEVVTLLVIARAGEMQNNIFSLVMQKLDKIYGSPKKRQPISIAKLKLKTTFTRLGREMRTRIGKIKYVGVAYLWLLGLLGKLYFKTKKGKTYLERLVEMSDTLVLDGKINTVMSGSSKQRIALQTILDQLEHAGKIYYGIHISNSSIMSCYVRDMKDDHIHFVDGSDGGYTRAAAMLKEKIRSERAAQLYL